MIDLKIIKMLVQYNYSSGNNPYYIVIHDTGNTGVKADSVAHYNYFNGGDRQASAHYFVDDKQVVQIIEDYNASWNCGDGYGKYGITNYNSIGIELCVNSDGNYNKAFDNTIKLTKILMKKYNIPASRVVRHYDASRKMCPYSMSSNNWDRWNQFKNSLNDTINNITSDKNEGIILADVLNVRSGAGTNYGILGQLMKGETVRIHKEINGWYDIYYGDNGGYVSKEYVKTNFGKEENKPVNKEDFDMDKIVLYAGDADVFSAILVAQKNQCPLMKVSDYEAKNIKVKEIIRIGGKPNTNRYDSLKEAAKLV